MDTQDICPKGQHAEQSIFISNYFSSNGDKIRNMNQLNDDSFWSETQSAQRNKNKKDITCNWNTEKCDFMNTYEQMQNDKNNTFTMSSYQKSCEDFHNSKADIKKLNMNSLQVQNILQAKNFLPDTKCRNSQIFKNDQETKFGHFEKASSCQSQKVLQTFGFENNTFIGTNHKNQNSTILFTKRDLFLKNLALLAKIKIQASNYYKKFTNIYRTRLLNFQIRQQIHDLSDSIPEQNSIFLIFLNEIIDKFQNVELFDIQQNQFFGFKLILMIINFFYFVFLSFVTVSQVQVNDNFQNYCYKIICCMWIIEIMISFNSKLYTENKIISDRKSVIIFYFKERMLFDCIALIFLILTFSQQADKFLLFFIRIMQFIKIYNLKKECRIIQLQLRILFKNNSYIQLASILINLFIITHIISLTWHLLSQFENQNTSQKLHSTQNSNSNWWNDYLCTFYLSLTLIAHGLNSYQTSLQNILAVIIIIFDIIMYGYLLSSVCSITYQKSKQQFKQNFEVSKLNQQLAQKNISKQKYFIYFNQIKFFVSQKREMKFRINQYINQYNENSDNLMSELKMFQLLPQELRDQLTIQMNFQILKNIQCFSLSYSDQTLEKLSLRCIDEIYYPEQIILTQDENDHFLFYIQEGQVEIQNARCKNQKNAKPYEILKKGDTFGQVSFFTGTDANCVIKCFDKTKVLKIRKSDFINIVKDQEEEFEFFCQTKDKILMYNNYKDVQLRCQFCQNYTHLTKDCLLINLNKKSFLYRIKINEQKQQNRRNFNRKLVFHHNSLDNLNLNQMLAFKFQFNNDKENFKEMDLIEYLQFNQSQNQSLDSSENLIKEVQEQNIDENFLQKELEACNKTYGSYLKSEILSYQAKKRSSIQSSKIVPISNHEIDDQQGQEKKFKQMGTLDKVNLQQNDPMQQLNDKELPKFENQKSVLDSDGVKKCKENNQQPQIEGNDDIFTNTKVSQYFKQMKGNSLSKILQEIENFSEYSFQNSRKKSQNERNVVEQQKQSNLNTPCVLSRIATSKNSQLQIKNNLQMICNNIAWDFDSFKNYQFYFSKGNSNLIIQKFNSIMEKNNQILKQIIK